jgi:hypothetical protein
MKPEEAIIRLRGFRNWLLNEFQRDVYVREINGMTSQIINRVQGKGKDAFGGMFTPYSEKYKKKREKRGMQTAYKNFTFEGFMWRDFGIKKAEKNKVILGGKTEDGQDKIYWNSQREKKNIIQPSQEEIKFLTKQVNDAILQALMATGLFKKA